MHHRVQFALYGTLNWRGAPIGFGVGFFGLMFGVAFGAAHGVNYNGGMATRTVSNLQMLFRCLLCCGVGIFFLSGCTLLPTVDRDRTPAGAYDHVLAEGWQAISDWQPVNLDADDEEEHLLLFRFDNGQVGALIVEGDPDTSISPPDRLLPRYFDDQGELGQGVIAPPETPTRAITVTQVSGDNPMRELIVLGGGTHLTFAWWKGTGLGYGVTQLYAPAGFAVDWETWQEEPQPISSVMGYTPLADYRARANLCDITLYTRRTDLPAETPAIVFRAEPQGLHFCHSTIPLYPFAPEGVVMAYLRRPRGAGAGIENLLTAGTTLAQLDAESAAERWPLELVADIAAYRSLPMRQEQAVSGVAPTTTVCVEFAEVANPSLRRWVIYTLRYQPPDVAQRLPDRWTISGAMAEPPPPEPPAAGYCEAVLARNAP